MTNEILAGMWSRILDVPDVNPSDNFFDLGGHSLLVTELLAEVEKIFGVDVPMADFFRRPTIVELAELIVSGRAQRGTPLPLERHRPSEGEAPPPVSFRQELLWFMERFRPGSALDGSFNIPVAFRVRGPLDARALRAALDEIVARHEPLRTRIGTGVDNRLVQHITPSQPVTFATHDFPRQPISQDELRDLLAREATREFDEAAPLLRCTLARTGPDEHLICLTVHHSVSDGWSLDVLLRELGRLYRSLAHSTEPLPPELEIRYQDFARWERAALTIERMEEARKYWEGKLHGMQAAALPFAKPRKAKTGNRGSVQSRRIETTGRTRAIAMAREEAATLFSTLLAVFQALMARETGSTDVAVLGVDASRQRREVHDMIGFFLNFLVLRDSVDRAGTFRDAVRQARRTVVDAIAHCDIPFNELMRLIPEARKTFLHKHSLFIAFQVLPEPEPLVLDRLEVDPVPYVVTDDPDLTHTVPADILVSVYDKGHELELTFSYNCEVFDKEDMSRMLDGYVAVMETLLDNPDVPMALLWEEDRDA